MWKIYLGHSKSRSLENRNITGWLLKKSFYYGFKLNQVILYVI